MKVKVRLNSGVTYQSRASIFPPVKKKSKRNKNRIVIKKKDPYEKMHKNFTKFDLLKLNAFGEDFDNYGSITLFGIRYEPQKINIDYIANRAQEEQRNKNHAKKLKFAKKNFPFFHSPSRNEIKNKNSVDNIKLPLIRNKHHHIANERNKYFPSSMSSQNLKNENIKDLNLLNLNLSNDILNKNDSSINLNKSESHRSINKKDRLPLFNNVINVTNKNVKLFLQTRKNEVQTIKNKRKHLLQKNCFIRRYDGSVEINNRLNVLNKEINKVNGLINKSINRNDEDIPQFNLRFNYLLSNFKN